MPGTKVFTGFGLRQVDIAPIVVTPGGTPAYIQIPSVEQAGFKLSVSEVEQWGDDKHQATFYHSQKGQLTVKGNKHSMAAFDMLSAGTVFSSAGSETMYFGTLQELTTPRVTVRGTLPVRMDRTGIQTVMIIYWFSCDVKTLWDSGPAAERAKITDVTFQFNTYPDYTDERGNPLPAAVSYAFGRFAI